MSNSSPIKECGGLGGVLAEQTNLGVASIGLALTALSLDGQRQKKDKSQGRPGGCKFALSMLPEREVWGGLHDSGMGAKPLGFGPSESSVSCPRWLFEGGAPSCHTRYCSFDMSATPNSLPPSPTLAFRCHPVRGPGTFLGAVREQAFPTLRMPLTFR